MPVSKQRTCQVVGLLIAVLGVALFLWRPWSGDAKSSAKRTTSIDAGPSGLLGPGSRPKLTPVKGTGELSIQGWVRGANQGAIANAQVIATLELGPGVGGVAPIKASAVVAVSGADGAFVLEGLEPGRHRLRIEGQGLVTAELRFVEAPGTGLVILVSREVELRGQVAGAEGVVSDVGISLRSETSTQSRQVKAALDGSFEFLGLAEGRYQLWAQGPGQASPSQWVERLGAGPFDEVRVQMQTAYTVTGRVVEQGQSEFGVRARISVQSALGTEPAREAISGEDGAFLVDGLLEGRWVATAHAPGYTSSESQSFPAGAQSALLLSLGGGGAVRGIVRSASGGALGGAQIQLVGVDAEGAEIRYAQGQLAADSGLALAEGQRFIPRGELGVLLGPIPLVPPPGAFVTRVASVVQRAEGDAPTDAVEALGRESRFITDELGRYEIYGVQPGRYRVHVRHTDFADAVSTMLNVRGNAKALVRNINLRSGTVLTGSVLTDKGVAVVGASVFARFSDGRDQAMSVTGIDGNFAFSPMSGALEVVVEAVGYGRFSKPITLAAGGLVAATKRLEVRLLRADAVMEGRLVDGAGFPIRDASVALIEDENGLPVRPARSDSDGLFRLEGLLPGMHSVAVRHPDYPLHVATVAAEPDVEIEVPLGAVLALRVLDASTENALPMAEVLLTRPSDGGEVRSVTDASGEVVFAALQAVPVVVLVRLKGYATASKKISLKAQPSRSAQPQSLSLSMSRGSVLAGIVRDAGGDRIEDAVIRVGERQARSDHEGRFRLEYVASGNVTLTIEAGGAVTAERLVIESGEERVTMELVADAASDDGARDAELPGDGDEDEDEDASDDDRQ